MSSIKERIDEILVPERYAERMRKLRIGRNKLKKKLKSKNCVKCYWRCGNYCINHNSEIQFKNQKFASECKDFKRVD